MTEILNNSRSTAMERSVKILGGLNRFYVATIYVVTIFYVILRDL